MNIAQWTASQTLPAEWAGILNGPVATLALKAMESEALKPRPLPMGHSATDATAAHWRNVGFLEAIELLRQMGAPAPAPRKPIEADFGAEEEPQSLEVKTK